MSNNDDIIRNPQIFSGGGVTGEFRIPFELSDGTICDNRNSETSPYQTFSPYKSDSINLTDYVNERYTGCDSVIEQVDIPIYKCSEDIQGNVYMLFKNQSGLNINQKKQAVGELYIVDPEGVKFEDLFGDLDLNLDVIDIQVFYDKVLVITETQIWFGNANTRAFFSVDYTTHYQTYYYKGDVYMLLDDVDFSVVKFDGNDIKTVTSNLDTVITSSSLKVRDNRIEIVYTDSTTNQLLTFAEYDLINESWKGFTTVDFPYEIIGVHDDSIKWFVYYEEVNTMPNNVGGICINFSQTIESEEESCPRKGDLNFTFEGGVLSPPLI